MAPGENRTDTNAAQQNSPEKTTNNSAASQPPEAQVLTYEIDGPRINGQPLPYEKVQLTEVPKCKEKVKNAFRIIAAMTAKVVQTDRKLPLLEIELLELMEKAEYKKLISMGWIAEKSVFLSKKGEVQGGARNIVWITPLGHAVIELLVAEYKAAKAKQEVPVAASPEIEGVREEIKDLLSSVSYRQESAP